MEFGLRFYKGPEEFRLKQIAGNGRVLIERAGGISKWQWPPRVDWETFPSEDGQTYPSEDQALAVAKRFSRNAVPV